MYLSNLSPKAPATNLLKQRKVAARRPGVDQLFSAPAVNRRNPATSSSSGINVINPTNLPSTPVPSNIINRRRIPRISLRSFVGHPRRRKVHKHPSRKLIGELPVVKKPILFPSGRMMPVQDYWKIFNKTKPIFVENNALIPKNLSDKCYIVPLSPKIYNIHISPEFLNQIPNWGDLLRSDLMLKKYFLFMSSMMSQKVTEPNVRAASKHGSNQDAMLWKNACIPFLPSQHRSIIEAFSRIQIAQRPRLGIKKSKRFKKCKKDSKVKSLSKRSDIESTPTLVSLDSSKPIKSDINMTTPWKFIQRKDSKIPQSSVRFPITSVNSEEVAKRDESLLRKPKSRIIRPKKIIKSKVKPMANISEDCPEEKLISKEESKPNIGNKPKAKKKGSITFQDKVESVKKDEGSSKPENTSFRIKITKNRVVLLQDCAKKKQLNFGKKQHIRKPRHIETASGIDDKASEFEKNTEKARDIVAPEMGSGDHVKVPSEEKNLEDISKDSTPIKGKNLSIYHTITTLPKFQDSSNVLEEVGLASTSKIKNKQTSAKKDKKSKYFPRDLPLSYGRASPIEVKEPFALKDIRSIRAPAPKDAATPRAGKKSKKKSNVNLK